MKSLRRAFTLVEIMIVVLIIGILVAIAVPNFVKARESARTKACIANLRQIDSAKEQYGIDNRLSAGSTISGFSVLAGAGTTTYMKTTPQCPSGGAYTINALGTNPVCSFSASGHILP